MASFVFNDFKKRYLEGSVNKTDTWTFIPVNKSFKETYEHDDIKLENYRNINDFKSANSSCFTYTMADSAIIQNNEYTANIAQNNSIVDSKDLSFNYSPTSIGGSGLLNGVVVNRTWSKVIDDEQLSNKPMFINSTNFDKFTEIYSDRIENNACISEYLVSGGFYFIRSKDELTWFADRSNTGNNHIIGVLGDNIEGVINGDPIGKNENYPFQGILDGNYYSLKNITIECNNVNNGLVGVLGNKGTIRNFRIENTKSVDNVDKNPNLLCNKAINLSHIKEDGSDINAAILVGMNYGTVENIYALGLNNFTFYGFVPEVYSVTNKSDNYSWRNKDRLVRDKFDTKNENYYYLNSFCINSPGNVCPYVGYFAEGYYGEDESTVARLVMNVDGNHAIPSLLYDCNRFNEYGSVLFYAGDVRQTLYPNVDKLTLRFILGYKYDDYTDKDNINKILGIYQDNTLKNFTYNLLGSNFSNENTLYTNSMFYTDIANNIALTGALFDENNTMLKTNALMMAKMPIYYGMDYNQYYTCGLMYNKHFKDDKGKTLNIETCGIKVCYNTNLISMTYGTKLSDWENFGCPDDYIQTSLRMNPMSRAAYNVGIIAGTNFGKIQKVDIRTTATNSGNFVGFIGGIAGKQSKGVLSAIKVNIDYNFEWDGTASNYSVVYKGTPILPPNMKNFTYKYKKEQYGEYIVSNSSNLDYYFSSFYDDICNTAMTITDDCVNYRLRPIFVNGGLIGRYVPCVEKDVTTANKSNCLITDCQLLYNDNVMATNNITGNYKRIENFAGALIGKIDFDMSTISTDQISAMSDFVTVTNSEISSVSSVGSNVNIHGWKIIHSTTTDNKHNEYNYYTYYEDYGPHIPYSAVCSSRYVGIYEIKNNILNSIATVNAYETTAENKMVEGNDTDVMYPLDFPFNIKKFDYDLNKDKSKYSNYNDGMWMRGNFYINNNYPDNYNKRNIASNFLKLSGCKTNITPRNVDI